MIDKPPYRYRDIILVPVSDLFYVWVGMLVVATQCRRWFIIVNMLVMLFVMIPTILLFAYFYKITPETMGLLFMMYLGIIAMFTMAKAVAFGLCTSPNRPRPIRLSWQMIRTALVDCSVCHKPYSSNALECPHCCQHPASKSVFSRLQLKNDEQKKKNNRKST